MKQRILELREQGYTYNQIQKELNCSKGTIAYHLGEGQKQKNMARQQKRRTTTLPGIVSKKLERFVLRSLRNKHRDFQRRDKSRLVQSDIRFTYHDVIAKFGEHPVCPYTGEVIDWLKPKTYNFDHIVPASRGGSNTLDNLAVCSSKANSAKADMTPEEFLAFCKSVVAHMEP